MVSKAIKKKINRIAERFDISLEQAKRFYFDRKEAKKETLLKSQGYKTRQ